MSLTVHNHIGGPPLISAPRHSPQNPPSAEGWLKPASHEKETPWRSLLSRSVMYRYYFPMYRLSLRMNRIERERERELLHIRMEIRKTHSPQGYRLYLTYTLYTRLTARHESLISLYIPLSHIASIVRIAHGALSYSPYRHTHVRMSYFYHWVVC